MPRTPRILLVMAGLAWTAAHAESPIALPGMTIEATRSPSDWRTTPAAVTPVETATIPGEPGLALDQYLGAVPGVFAQNRYNLAQGLRLSIRGFGARAGFGVRGVRVLVDGIPLTLPDGQTELDALDLALIERIEVLRGPASALYGNAAGGVVLLHTRNPAEPPGLSFDFAAGELGLRQLRAESRGSREAVSGLGAIALREQSGFREQGAAESAIVNGKLRWNDGAGRLTLGLNALEVAAQDAGGLTATEVRQRRRAAAPNNLRFDAGEDIRQQRLSALWESAPGADSDYQLRAWGGQREFANRLPFMAGGQSSFERNFGGLGGQVFRQGRWLGVPQRLTLGLDIEAQRDDRQRHDNLEGQRGSETLHQRESATSTGVYLDSSFELGPRWLASIGLRRDRLRLAVDDEFRADGDDSGGRRLNETSHHLALGFRLDDAHFFYARIGSAFESPTIAELANPGGGGFNPALASAQALNRELGLKAERENLRYELVLFSVDVNDELLRFELPAQPGRSFFRNAGRSRRDGVELSADWRLSQHWQLGAAYTYADYRFERYELNGNDFSGNEIPGIPRQQLSAELRYQDVDWHAGFSVTALDRLFADDANAVRVAGYALANLRIGLKPSGARQWTPYLGVNNIFGHEYNDNIRINAGGQRYFEPAPGAMVYAGIRAQW
jgi:iron complex outermembrane recepter protein